MRDAVNMGTQSLRVPTFPLKVGEEAAQGDQFHFAILCVPFLLVTYRMYMGIKFVLFFRSVPAEERPMRWVPTESLQQMEQKVQCPCGGSYWPW